MARLKRPTMMSANPKLTTPAKPTNLMPITLSDPGLVAKHLNGYVSLIHNVLPKDLAARLFLSMVDESLGSEESGRAGWEKNRWYLVDREVESPHTTMFYVEKTGSYSQAGYLEAAQYWYNGQKRPARFFSAEIDEAREVITTTVRNILDSRARQPLESKKAWTPNVAAANCYRGRHESVGFHSDVLTYLGPYPTIASLSLGVARPFRIRRVSQRPSHASDSVRTIDVTLPHNSLCIMHAGFQEIYKHCVPAVSSMDLFRISKGSNMNMVDDAKSQGWKERINMTFRFYRPDFAPQADQSIGYKGTPVCLCGVPCNLRPDAKGKVRARREKIADHAQEKEESDMLFFWTCNAGSQNKGKNCGFFKLLDMKSEGRGEWFPSKGIPQIDV